METKVNMGTSAMKLIGIIYTILGSVFTALGLGLGLGLREVPFFLIFGGLGSIFLVLGIVFLILEGRKKRRFQKLVSAGRYLWAEVVDVDIDSSVRVNGSPMRRIVVRYTDPYGTAHLFRSQPARFNFLPEYAGKKVRVYCDPQDLKHYYVDIDNLLQGVQYH